MVTAPATAINVQTPKLIAHTSQVRRAAWSGLCFADAVVVARPRGLRTSSPPQCEHRFWRFEAHSGQKVHSYEHTYASASVRRGRPHSSQLGFICISPASRADNIIAGYDKCHGDSLADSAWLSCGR